MYVIRKVGLVDGEGGRFYYREIPFKKLSDSGWEWVADPFIATQFTNESEAKLTGDKLGEEYEVVELRSLLDAPK